MDNHPAQYPSKAYCLGTKEAFVLCQNDPHRHTTTFCMLASCQILFCSIAFEHRASNPKLQLRIYHEIHKRLKVSNWIPTKNDAYCVYCSMQCMLYNLNIYQCDPACISFTSKRKLVWFSSKTNRNPIAASAQKSTRTGTYWSRAVDWIAATSASPWHGMAGIWHHCVVVSGTACVGILWKHLFSYGISKDQPKLVVLRDMDTGPWKDAFWTSI